MVVQFVSQGQWNDAKGPMNIDKPSPKMVVKPDSPQWLKDLERDGFVVVKSVVPKERAAEYARQGEDWLEGLKFGYKRDDTSTWDVQKLPKHNHGGLYSHYSFAHAQFVWDAKAEPGIVDLFEKIWGTDKLTVSFDGGSLAVPLPAEQVQGNKAPWPHSDQSAYRPWTHCIQGLLNLLPIGREDGGLVVMKGTAQLFGKYFEEHKHLEPAEGWTKRDGYNWTDEQLKWFTDRGCEWVKPDMEPGDFVLWDSRTVHYGAAPMREKKRFAIYICYKPDEFMTEEQRERKVEAFKRGYCTSHDPTDFVIKDKQDANWNILLPYGTPELSEKTKKAIGLVPYS
ncbi:hypothetical protein BCR39DRAFT_556072 [Naematelia encephala]|uniref:Phytanoyl-CoA dioxygenase n=1 Tax=Naematelia encephala TaxID=71784 RepID=A0A1Y2BID6_9TREE|nr:hypothetical protein BCR39DRAFT_556072 [Naematelia encephala]